jgi:hypothetical protein
LDERRGGHARRQHDGRRNILIRPLHR